MFADMAARIAAVLAGSDVGEPHPRDHDPEGCAACRVLDGPPGLPEQREQEIRREHRHALATRSTPTDSWLNGYQRDVGDLLAALDAVRAERAGLLARAEQAECDLHAALDYGKFQDARVASLEQALTDLAELAKLLTFAMREARGGFVDEQGDWLATVGETLPKVEAAVEAARVALAGPGDPEEPLCPVCQGPTRPTGPGERRCVGGCYWPQGEETQ